MPAGIVSLCDVLRGKGNGASYMTRATGRSSSLAWDRCLRRHGVSNLRDLREKTPKPTHKPFKAYEPGFMHIDVKYLPQMADENRHRYLFVAIDRATRWVFIRIYSTKTAANARRFLRDLERACPLSGHCVAMPCRAVNADQLHSHG